MSLKAPERPTHTDYDDDNSHNRLGWKKPVAALALLGTTAVAGFIGLKGDSDKAPVDRTATEPVASAPAKPGKAQESETAKPEQTATPEQTASPEAQPAGEFGISAAEFENNPEQLGREYYAQHNAYWIAGATEEAARADRSYEIPMEQYVAEISAPIDNAFVEAMFIDEWEANPALLDYVTTEIAIANRTRELRLLSYVGDNPTPYVREDRIESMTTTGAPIITTSTRWTGYDNGPETAVANNMDGQDVNTMAGGETFVWVNVDGQMKISDISHYDG